MVHSDSTKELTLHEHLAKQLGQVLSVEGKGQVSVWQLNWHLELYQDDPEAVVREAPRLLQGRQAGTESPQWMSSRDWLLRCGLEAYTFAMEEEGVLFARQFQEMSKDDLKNNFKIKDEGHLLIMETLLQNDEKHGDILQGFLKPSRPRILREFFLAYPAAPAHLAANFAMSLSDQQGRGLVSLTQLLNHFKRHSEVETAVGALKEELLQAAERLEPPEKRAPPPEPTDWVVQWLKDADLAQYVQGFIAQAMKIREDLLRFPITEEQLEKTFGVKTLGQRRMLSWMIDSLREEVEVEVALAKEMAKSEGHARVVAHIQEAIGSPPATPEGPGAPQDSPEVLVMKL